MSRETKTKPKTPGMVDQIANALRAEILGGFKVGQRLPSLRTLARRFDVSPTVMWAGLDLLVREETIQARQGAGYFVAERVSKQHVGILLELDFSMSTLSCFWPRVVQAVRDGLRQHGYRSRFYAGKQRPGEYQSQVPCLDLIEDIEDDRLSGLVLVFGTLPADSRQLLKQRSVPVVGTCSGLSAAVQFDYAGLIRDATRHLIAQGRRKLAFMEWVSADPHWVKSSPMFMAFKQELELHGVSLNERWVRHDLRPGMAGAGWADFREIWSADSEKPDGLIVADDVLFKSAAQAIQEMGIRMPDQLQVVTHGNKDSGFDYPFPVSVLEADPEEYAAAMVELMVRQLRHEPLEQSVIKLPFRWAESGVLSPAALRGRNERLVER